MKAIKWIAIVAFVCVFGVFVSILSENDDDGSIDKPYKADASYVKLDDGRVFECLYIGNDWSQCVPVKNR